MKDIRTSDPRVYPRYLSFGSLETRLVGRNGKPDVCVAKSTKVICLPPRSGSFTFFTSKYFAAGSSNLTSPRCAMSAKSRAVNTLVMEPISNTVSPLTGRLSPNPIVPYETMCDPLESIIPTTIPVACFCTSTRVDNIFRIASSSGIGEACDGAAHVAPAIKNMTRTKRSIGLTRHKIFIDLDQSRSAFRFPDYVYRWPL